MNVAEGIRLFSKWPVESVLQQRMETMLKQIDRLPDDVLLGSDPGRLATEYAEEASIAVPLIKDEEKRIDVEGDEVRIPLGGGAYASVPGLRITFHVPFEGDSFVFNAQPSTFTTSGPPRVKDVSLDREVLIVYEARYVEGQDYDQRAALTYLERMLDDIRRHLDWVEQHIGPYNAGLKEMARRRIDARREKLLRDRGMVEALGIPMRRRSDAPQTYVVPTARKKVAVSRPAGSPTPYVPEPTLDIEEYERILSIISNMATVIERSPHVFREMEEEDLRQHFLVQLNGRYEGQATGETFNYQGKTDILVRWEGKNVFIAECKFWNGPKSLEKALEQLLGYAAWRDTKTALLVFNRRKSFSTILEKIPEVVESHPNYKGKLPYEQSETGFRFVLHHPDDSDRELILTVMAFNVPK